MTAGILILVFVPEPKRGSVDQSTSNLRTRTSWLCDMKALLKKYDSSVIQYLTFSSFSGVKGLEIGIREKQREHV